MFRKVTSILLMVVLLLSIVGCTKGGDANEIAQNFVNDIASGKGYKSIHKYIEYNESLELNKDSNGNYKVVYSYDDGQVDEVYKIGTEYAVYINGEVNTEYYNDEELQEMIDAAIEDIEFYPADSLEVFDPDIESDIKEADGKDAFVAYGTYDDNTDYEYFYGTDGSYFELLDVYDDIRIDLDDTFVVELP